MTPELTTGFGVGETHGILWQPANEIHAASDGLGWSSLYASTQRESPYESAFSSVRDHLIILHLDGPVGVSRALGRSQTHRVVGAGGLFLLPGGLDFGVRLEGALESLHVYLRQQILEEVAIDFGVKDAEKVELMPQLGVRDAMIEQLVLCVRDVLAHPHCGSQMYVDYVARVLAAHLLRQHSVASGAERAASVGGLTRTQIDRATDYMETNLAQPLTLDDVANASGLSPSHFARRFKLSTGAPPHQFLMNMRVERAKRMLLQLDSIADIALACGFTHQEHLTRIFRRMTGVTPAQFRRAMQV